MSIENIKGKGSKKKKKKTGTIKVSVRGCPEVQNSFWSEIDRVVESDSNDRA